MEKQVGTWYKLQTKLTWSWRERSLEETWTWGRSWNLVRKRSLGLGGCEAFGWNLGLGRELIVSTGNIWNLVKEEETWDGAECFTKGLPLQAKQRQPSPALAFSPNGHYGVKIGVFWMISIYLDLSILCIMWEIFLLKLVVSEKILWDVTALICFYYYFFLSDRSDGFPPPVARHELPHSPANRVYQDW